MQPERVRRAVLVIALAVLATGCKHVPLSGSKSGYQSASSETDVHVQDSRAVSRMHAEEDATGLAYQRLGSGDLDQAEKEARRALSLNEKSLGAWTVLAVIAQKRGDVKRAGEAFRHAAELSPNNGRMLNNYGAWLCANGFAAESLVWFDRALAAPGYASSADALANAGGCALQTGQYERVESNLRKALELVPTNAYALVSMARNEYRIGHYFDARAFIERRLAAAPPDADVLQLAADIETKLGDGRAANRYEQRLRAEFPDASATRTGNNLTP